MMEGPFKKAVQTVINKAWEDDSYRASLVANPNQAIQNLTGLQVPAGVNLVFNDQTDASISFINIPPKPNPDDMELTDEQLEQVAGGEFFVGAAIIGIVGALGAATIGAGGAVAAAGIDKGW